MPELWSVLIGGVVGLLGVIVGVWLSAFYAARQQQRQTQTQLTLELYTEFQNEGMLQARIVTHDLLTKRQGDLDLGFEGLRHKISREEWLHLSRVAHFFEKFAVLYNAGHLSKELTAATLQRFFIWWYTHHLRRLVEVSIELDPPSWGAWAVAIKDAAVRFGLE